MVTPTRDLDMTAVHVPLIARHACQLKAGHITHERHNLGLCPLATSGKHIVYKNIPDLSESVIPARILFFQPIPLSGRDTSNSIPPLGCPIEVNANLLTMMISIYFRKEVF